MSAATPRWIGDLSAADLDAAISLLRQVITDQSTVVIAAHVAPDGDTLGAALALHLALSAEGVDTRPTVGERPLKVPAALSVLPGVEDLVGGPLPDASEVALLITVDAASPDRLGSVAGYLDAQVPTLVLDHHSSGTVYGDLRLVAPRAGAAVMIVALLLDELGMELTRDIAACLYAGLVTDTGRFGHAKTDGSAMRLGARLLEAGVDHADLNRRLFDKRSLGQLRLLGRALDRVEYVAEVALVHTYLTAEELARAASGLEAVEPLVDMLHTVDIAEVALVLKPAPEGGWRVSMRSRGGVDVGVIATRFGGGGHVDSAGFASDQDGDVIVTAVVAALRALS